MKAQERDTHLAALIAISAAYRAQRTAELYAAMHAMSNK